MSEELFDIHKYDQFKANNRLEVKKALGGFPLSLWESYSAFANSEGGVIILGVKEHDNGSWAAVDLKFDEVKEHLKTFWKIVNDPQKVSVNLLEERDVHTYKVGSEAVVVIRVPAASRTDRPVYLNGDVFVHTYRRGPDGDYLCSKSQVRAMMRDQDEHSSDCAVLEYLPLDCLNADTVQSYKNRHAAFSPANPLLKLSAEDYLRSIGAAELSKFDDRYHPTAAGLLMFGNEREIVRQFPDYFLDFKEVHDLDLRWTDRLQSSSGDWSGNLYDFYLNVYYKIRMKVEIPFKLEGGVRIDDTPIHKALREALANCLINADFYEPRGVVITLEDQELRLENPGGIRVGLQQMRCGGVSDPRNKGLMKMFNLIDIGERAGSGVPSIFRSWSESGLVTPQITEEDNPPRTKLILLFRKEQKQTLTPSSCNDSSPANIPQAETTGIIGTADSLSAGHALTQKTLRTKNKIIEILHSVGVTTAAAIAAEIGLSAVRTRAILSHMPEVESSGANRNRTYHLKSGVSV